MELFDTEALSGASALRGFMTTSGYVDVEQDFCVAVGSGTLLTLGRSVDQ
jgi:hypothetical protein